VYPSKLPNFNKGETTMTYQGDFTLPQELLERIASEGFDILPQLIQIVINAAMQAERQQYLRAAPYQHSPERQGYANGFKPKTVKTRLGEITFDIPQVREGGFYPQALEKGLRSERALTLTLAEMYVQGYRPAKWPPSPNNCVAQRSPLLKSAGRPPCWMRAWKPGATVGWAKSSTCFWMLAMRKCAWTVKFGM
jgi:hypothetical protein